MSNTTTNLLKRLALIGTASNRLLNLTRPEKKAPTQQLVLDILAKEDGVTSGVLAEVLDMRPSSLTQILNKLASRGEIKRIEDPGDKRIKRVYLTDIGRKKAQVLEEKNDHSADFFAGLTKEEQEQLDYLLEKIVASWPDKYAKQADVPVNPFEAMESWQAFQQQFAAKMEGLAQLSPQERRQLKKEWKEKIRQEQRKHHGGPRGDRNKGPFAKKNPNNDEATSDSNEWENW